MSQTNQKKRCTDSGFHGVMRHKRDGGASVLGVLIAAGIGTVLAAGLGQIVINGIKGQKHTELRGDRDSVRRMLLDAVSCAETLPTETCTPKALISLKRSSALGPRELVSATKATLFGDLAVRAECNATGDGVSVRAVRLKTSGNINSKQVKDFIPDPLTGKVVTWQSKDSLLYPTNFDLCIDNGSDSKIESGAPVVPSRCDGVSYTGDLGAPGNLCSGDFYEVISFKKKFNKPPKVIVALNLATDPATLCAAGTSDMIVLNATGVTTSGFRLNCSSSPMIGHCGALHVHRSKARCSWIAISE